MESDKHFLYAQIIPEEPRAAYIFNSQLALNSLHERCGEFSIRFLLSLTNDFFFF